MGYLSGSTVVEFITDQVNNPADYEYIVIKEFDTAKESLRYENKLLVENDAAKNCMFYNKTNGNFTDNHLNIGSVWVTNGEVDVKLKAQDNNLEVYLNNGFNQGRCFKNKDGLPIGIDGKIAVHKTNEKN